MRFVAIVILVLAACGPKPPPTNMKAEAKAKIMAPAGPWWSGYKIKPLAKTVKNPCDESNLHVVACNAIGYSLLFRLEQPTKALEIFEKLCREQKFGPSCYYEAVIAEQQGDSPFETYEKMKKACLQGMPSACGELGSRLYQGTGITKNKERGKAQSETACRLKDALSCDRGASMFHKEGQFAKAMELYRIACSRGFEPSCQRLGLMEAEGCPDGNLCGKLPAVKNQEDGRQRMLTVRKTCDAKLTDYTCSTVSIAMEKGDLHEYDSELAFEYARKACDAGGLWGCSLQARYYMTGTGVVTDEEKGAALFAKTCKSGFAPACSFLGQLHMQKKVESADSSKAYEYFARACELGIGEACRRVILACSAGTMTCPPPAPVAN